MSMFCNAAQRLPNATSEDALESALEQWRLDLKKTHLTDKQQASLLKVDPDFFYVALEKDCVSKIEKKIYSSCNQSRILDNTLRLFKLPELQNLVEPYDIYEDNCSMGCMGFCICIEWSNTKLFIDEKSVNVVINDKNCI